MPPWKTDLEVPWAEELGTDPNALTSSCPCLSCRFCLLFSETRPKSQLVFKALRNQASQTHKVNRTAKAHVHHVMWILIKTNIQGSLAGKEKGRLFHTKKATCGIWKRFSVWSPCCCDRLSRSTSISRSRGSCFPHSNANNSPCTYWAPATGKKLSSLVYEDPFSARLTI